MLEEYDTVIINYWNEIKNNFVEVFEGSSVILVTHNSAEFKDIIKFINKIPEVSKITYMSLTKSYKSFKHLLSGLEADAFVVDCVSRGVFEISDAGTDCVYLNPPSNIDDLTTMVESAASEPSDFVVIDGMSLFFNFSDNSNPDSIVSFCRQLSYMSNRFILLYDENNAKHLRNLPAVYVNKIIRMEVVKEQINWED